MNCFLRWSSDLFELFIMVSSGISSVDFDRNQWNSRLIKLNLCLGFNWFTLGSFGLNGNIEVSPPLSLCYSSTLNDRSSSINFFEKVFNLIFDCSFWKWSLISLEDKFFFTYFFLPFFKKYFFLKFFFPT